MLTLANIFGDLPEARDLPGMLKPSFDDLLGGCDNVPFNHSTWTHGVTLGTVSSEMIRDWKNGAALQNGGSSTASTFGSQPRNTVGDLVQRAWQRFSKGVDRTVLSQEELDDLVVDRRTKLWTMALLFEHQGDPGNMTAVSGNFNRLKFPFRLNSALPRYTLVPNTGSHHNIPLQRIHRSEWAIPSELAGKLCHDFTVEELSRTIQHILVSHRLLDNDLKGYLVDAQRKHWDIGTLYAHLRPWWYSQDPFGRLIHKMNIQKGRDRYLRKRPEHNSKEITVFRIPPRRVWDLLSNRVVPTSGLKIPASSFHVVPDNMWAVSHSWVAQADLEFVETAINQRQWRVPRPKATTFDHIRIELLNMGAEYVFLDVLCLRQRKPSNPDPNEERIRQEEWSTDIPSLGHIYRHTRYQTVVTYFNGLGLPFAVDANTLATDLHWFNRVWTLQETVVNWLPGGLHTGFLQDLASGRGQQTDFMRRMQESFDSLSLAAVGSDPPWEILRFEDLLEELRRRPGYAAKKSFDRVAALAYLLPYITRPVYDENWDNDEDAWAALVWNMPPAVRLDLLLRYPAYASEVPQRSSASENTRPLISWRPCWQQIMNLTDLHPQALTTYHHDCEKLQVHGDWGFYHQAYVLSHCSVACDKDGNITVAVSQRVGQNQGVAIDKNNYTNLKLKPDKELSEDDITLVCVLNVDCWIIGRESGTICIEGQEAVILEKIGTGHMMPPLERNEINELAQKGKRRYVAYPDPR